MTKFVVFENSGEIDRRLISSFGVNVKDGDNPIGFFGTGLKYALSILVRTGHHVTIQSGRDAYIVSTAPAEIRGKQFNFVALNGEPMGFTTEVGKSWDLWMAYRELYCNATDESGHAYESDAMPEPFDNITRVIVEGDDFMSIRRQHDRYFLSGTPLWESGATEIHDGPGHGIYYRGVLVSCAGKRGHALYRYNIIEQITLTEDRTAREPFSLQAKIGRALSSCDSEALICAAVTAPEGTYENGLDFDWGQTPGPTFMRVLGGLAKSKIADINQTALKLFERHAETATVLEPTNLNRVEQRMLEKALRFCSGMGFDITHEIIPVENMGKGILGMARHQRIYIARQAFMLGTKQVAATLIEEHLHLTRGFTDCSRAFQDYLLNSLVSAGEQLTGEPL